MKTPSCCPCGCSRTRGHCLAHVSRTKLQAMKLHAIPNHQLASAGAALSYTVSCQIRKVICQKLGLMAAGS